MAHAGGFLCFPLAVWVESVWYVRGLILLQYNNLEGFIAQYGKVSIEPFAFFEKQLSGAALRGV